MKEQFAAFGRVVVRLFIPAVFVLSISGCGLEAPEAPSWDTTLTIPLINRSYSSAELIEKLANENIKIDDNGNSTIQIERELDTVTIESILEIAPIEANFNKQVGRLRIVSPENQQQALAFSDYVPLVLGEVPDTGVAALAVFGEASSFSEAEIDEADITITATNNTGFDLDSLSGRLINQHDGSLLATFVVPSGLVDGAQYSQQYPLDGKSVGAQLDFELYFHTPGGPALSLADRAIDITIDYSDEIYVSSAYGKLESFAKDYTQRTHVPDDVQVERATLSGGVLTFTAHNTLSTPVELSFTFPEITQGGATLFVNGSLAGGGVMHEQVDLAGYEITPTNDSLLVRTNAFVPGTGDNYINVDSDDEFQIDLAIDDVVLTSARAVVPPTELTIASSEVDVEVTTGFENITLELVELNVTINNYTELSGDVLLSMQASNGKSFQVLGSVSGRDGSSAAIGHIYSDQLADFLTPYPDQITVSGTATVGDGVTTVDLSANDFVSAKVVISAPMAFEISQAIVEGDKNELTVDDDIADGADRLNHGNFRATMRNHLPLGAQMLVYIGADSASLFTAPLTVIGPVSFNAGTTDANGTVSQEVVTESNVELTTDDLHVFTNRNLFVAPVLEFMGTNGQTVRIRASDYMAINGVIEINARVGGEE